MAFEQNFSPSFSSGFSSILMEYSLKLSRLSGTRMFLLVDSADGRRFSGDRHLCDAYLSGSLRPLAGEVEMLVDHGLSALHEKNANYPHLNSGGKSPRKRAVEVKKEVWHGKRKKVERQRKNSNGMTMGGFLGQGQGATASKTLWSDGFGTTKVVQVEDDNSVETESDDGDGDTRDGDARDWIEKMNHVEGQLEGQVCLASHPLPPLPSEDFLRLCERETEDAHDHLEPDTSWILKDFVPNNAKVELVKLIDNPSLFTNKLSSGSKLVKTMMCDFSTAASEKCRHRNQEKCHVFFNRCFEEFWAHFENLHQLKIEMDSSSEQGWRFRTLYSNLKWIAKQSFHPGVG